MKAKITDLMDLYEDRNCPLSPTADQSEEALNDRSRGEDGRNPVEIKASRHRYGWKEFAALAAVLVLLVLSGFAVRQLLDRRGLQPGQTGDPRQTETRFIGGEHTLEQEEQLELNRFLTAFAQQGVENLDADLDEDAELIRFAFIYRRIYDPESIPVQPDDDGELWDTLSPEQVNETLTRLLGRTVTPDETADYNLLRSDPVGGHCSFHDGYFWQEPSGGDHLLRFVLTDRPLRMEDAAGPCVITDFTAYAVNLTLWPLVELDALPALSQEEAEALVQAEKLKPILTGRAQARITEDGYRLWSLASQPYELDDEEDPHTEPTGFDTVPEADRAEMARLVNALVQQGITDLDADLSGEYELAQFAHIYTKIYNWDAITYRSLKDGSYETLTLEKVNRTLNELFGKSVSPAEGTDYTAQRGDNYAQHESYHDGIFWWPAADGEIHTRFAVPGYLQNDDAQSWEIGFEVFEADLNRWPEYPDWDQTDYEAIRGFQEEGKLQTIGTGTAKFLKNGDGLMVSAFHVELMPQPEEPQDDALTAEIKSLFEDEHSWYCRALLSEYPDPTNVDLFEFFYAGDVSGDGPLTEEETAALFSGDFYDEDGNLHVPPTDRLTRAGMDEALTQCFGLTLDETARRNLDWFKYLPETGCWYHSHGDTNTWPVTVKDVRQLEDGTVLFTHSSVCYSGPTFEAVPLWTAVLQPVEGGGYHILSNLPGAWVTAEDAGALIQLYWGTGTMQLETTAADGTKTARELTLGADGSVYYREGDPDSEFSHWENGGWWIVDEHTLGVEHWVTDENGCWLGEYHVSRYACEIRDNQLILTQQSETGFANDPAGIELRFPFYKK